MKVLSLRSEPSTQNHTSQGLLGRQEPPGACRATDFNAKPGQGVMDIRRSRIGQTGPVIVVVPRALLGRRGYAEPSSGLCHRAPNNLAESQLSH